MRRLAALLTVTVTVTVMMLMVSKMLAALVHVMHAIRAGSSPAELENKNKCDKVEKAFEHRKIIPAR